MAIVNDPFISLLEQGFDPSGGGFTDVVPFLEQPLVVDVFAPPIDTTFVTPTKPFEPLPIDLPLLFDASKAGEIERMQGFSDTPLVVDVTGSPIDTTFQTPTKTSQEVPVDFTSVFGGGPIGFPTATQPDLLGVISQGLNFAQSFISPESQLPATIAQAGTLSVNAVACPTAYTSGGRLVHQHLRKQQIKSRKSPVTQCVTNRHMNSLNPHALRRATRRLSGFMSHVKTAEKAIRHALGHTLPHPRRSASRAGCRTCGQSRRNCMC